MKKKKAPKRATLIGLRPYQLAVYDDRRTGIIVLHWARQIGKSFTLAAWAVDRLLSRPGRLVTVLSNSRENGAEFLQKCGEVCVLMGDVMTRLGAKWQALDASPDPSFENMRMEVHITITDDKGREYVGRIKVLAANPRTARGFSGDLILDEFAFHEDSNAIWEAAEPILSSNQDFLCRIASTGNGKHNMFYRLAAMEMSSDGEISSGKWRVSNSEAAAVGMSNDKCQVTNSETAEHPSVSLAPIGGEGRGEGAFISVSQSGFALSRVTRTQAYGMGVKIYDQRTREETTPEAARAQALDKRAYDQNYECAFADENFTLLSHELINAAEREGVGELADQDWSAAALARLRAAEGDLYAGFDVARRVDLSVITVVEKLGGMFLVRAILRMQDLRLPEQQIRLGEICRLPKFRRVAIDMTGLGLGLFEYAQREFGAGRIQGINFATTVPATRAVSDEGRKREMVRVTEALAMELLQAYEDRRIQQPQDGRLRDDLRKPERVTTPGGRVSIAATRDEAGHADHFWSLALALEAAGTAGAPFAAETFKLKLRTDSHRRILL